MSQSQALQQRQTAVLLAARLGFESVSTLASCVTAHKVMDATPYEYTLLISEKACSRAASTCSRTGTGFACTDDSDNIDSIFVVSAWCEEDETATNGLLPIDERSNQRNELSKNLYINIREGLQSRGLYRQSNGDGFRLHRRQRQC
jgi:hypothetical protein